MTADLDRFYQRMADRLKQLQQERAEHEEILAFYAKVLVAQDEAQNEVVVPEIKFQEDHLEMKIEEGFSIIERESFPWNRDCAKRLFHRICQVSLEENPVLARAGQILLDALGSDGLDFFLLVEAILQNNLEGIESIATELDVPSPVLQALAKLSLQPSLLASAAAVAQRVPLGGWQHTYCPVCGSLPAIAALVGEEGKRQALCSFCGHLWQIPRVGCPFCNTAKQEDLSYFYGEGEDFYRVQVCNQCRGYLKVVDAREKGHAEALAADDVATTHLDLLAEEQGYQRKAPRLWGI